MADMLRRELAPITTEAWAEIDDQATRTLKGNLSARALVDVTGPQGWTLGAVNLGSVKPGKGEPVKGVKWGTREVQPLIEINVPFSLNVADLDSVGRGGKTPELGPVADAASKAARFEESAVYQGFKEGGIVGMLQTGKLTPVSMPRKPEAFARAVEDGIHAIQAAGIGGPFNLVLGRVPYQMLTVGDEKGYPLKTRVLDMLGGGLYWSPAVKWGAIMSGRGGDFELTLGQDLSLGYAGHGGGKVDLYVTESFTFRVLEPSAAVEIKAKA